MIELDLNRLKEEIVPGTNAMTLLDLTDIRMEEGRLTLTVEIQEKHLNAHGKAHGGVLYAICDQAVAAFDIALGRDGVGMDGSMHYYRPAEQGDVLKAIVTNRKMGRKTAVHLVELVNQKGKIVCDAMFTSMYLDQDLV